MSTRTNDQTEYDLDAIWFQKAPFAIKFAVVITCIFFVILTLSMISSDAVDINSAYDIFDIAAGAAVASAVVGIIAWPIGVCIQALHYISKKLT